MSTTAEHPFAPGGPIPRALLEAYVSGRCTPGEQHTVERAMEADPLVREAVEGLRMQGALDTLHTMRPPGPPPPPATAARVVLAIGAAVLLAGTWLVVSPLMEAPPKNARVIPPRPATPDDALALPPVDMDITEVITADERPTEEHIGHSRTDRHHRAMQEEVERIELERMAPRPVDAPTVSPRADPRPLRAPRTSRQLVFLHDLKLVHPDELYPFDPLVHGWQGHTPAAHADSTAQRMATGQVWTSAYLPFMEGALARFAAHDHKRAMMDLLLVLEQYPQDVNALFYAGLCAYNLGMLHRAVDLLERAAHHRIDTFDEEAEWYLALTLEQMGEHAAARAAFARITARGGFYAERAQARY